MNALRRVASIIPGMKYLIDLKSRFDMRYCRGVYKTYQDARCSIPSNKLIGYDNIDAANLYIDHLNWLKPSEKALLERLDPLLTPQRTVFDFGGNLGRSYYVFQKYLPLPTALRWIICDLPAVIAAARGLARHRNETNLQFTTDFARANGAEILLTCGTLQYAEQELPELLSTLHTKPAHLLINRLPLSHRRTYYTVQDIGPSRCPYRVANWEEFTTSLHRLGYSLVDSWECPECACRILFHPERTVCPYTGMYWRLGDPG